MKDLKYPVAKPQLARKSREYILDALDKNEISWRGGFCDEFEEMFSERHGAKYGVGATSGTTALTLAVAAIRQSSEDEFIVPEFTMVATAWAVIHAHAKPVFVDCKPDDFTIDPEKIEAKITKNTKAIMPVHVFGRRADMDAIMKIATKHNLRVIEDAALAHGMEMVGDIACYAFFANKILTSGEGGICITNNKYLHERMVYLKNMSFDENHTFLHKEIGYNFRLTNFQAAVLKAETEELEQKLEKRKQIEEWYNKALKDVKGIRVLPNRVMCWMYDIWVEDAEKKQPLMDFLKKNEIDTRHYFKPMSMQPMYNDFLHSTAYKTLNAYEVSLHGFYLPTYTQLEESDIIHIVSKIKEFLGS